VRTKKNVQFDVGGQAQGTDAKSTYVTFQVNILALFVLLKRPVEGGQDI